MASMIGLLVELPWYNSINDAKNCVDGLLPCKNVCWIAARSTGLNCTMVDRSGECQEGSAIACFWSMAMLWVSGKVLEGFRRYCTSEGYQGLLSRSMVMSILVGGSGGRSDGVLGVTWRKWVNSNNRAS